MNYQILKVLLISILLTGCASLKPPEYLSGYHVPRDEGVRLLESKVSCCKNLAELKYEQIHNLGKAGFKVTPESPSYTFPEGKSFYKALKLNDTTIDKKMVVSTYPVSSSITGGWFWRVSIIFLDGAHNSVANYAEDKFSYQSPSWDEPQRYSLILNSGDIPKTAKYLIIYSSQKAINSYSDLSMPSVTAISSGSGVLPVLDSSSGTYLNGATGSVAITIE